MASTMLSNSRSNMLLGNFHYQQQKCKARSQYFPVCATSDGNGNHAAGKYTNGTGSIMINNTTSYGSPKIGFLSHPFESSLMEGRLVESVVFRQTFVVRSYEVGAQKTTNLEVFLNYFQETALNHASSTGLAGDGFGATHEMIRNNLIWVVSRMQVQVDKYPTWGDGLEIDTWVAASGKHGMRRDWLVRDYKNGTILARASSTWAMMNRLTRRLSKMPEEVGAEIRPWFIARTAFHESDTTAKMIEKPEEESEVLKRSGLTPRHSDLDMNQHVNNVKYLGWTMDSLPRNMFDSHQLVGVTLQYRKECGKGDVVESLTHPPQSGMDHQQLEFTHMLRLETDGSEIVRSRTTWKRRQSPVTCG